MNGPDDNLSMLEGTTPTNKTAVRIIAGPPVLVQTDRFRCLAYQDKQGKWRDYYHKDELNGNIEVVNFP